MYKLNNVAKRGSALVAAVSLLAGIGTSMLPAFASADALNPLTDRSLLLSSSSPGWSYSDGAGDVGTSYALPGSGPNGLKTGETFSFKTSTDSSSDPLKAFTFQYCTTAAGYCQAPGNDSGGLPNATTPVARGVDTTSTADLNVVTAGHTPVEGTDFLIYLNGSGTPVSGTDWSMSASNLETNDGTAGAVQTGKNNFITLTTSGAGLATTAGESVKIVFVASTDDYITNPGSDAFFVKINDYDDNTTPIDPATNTHLIDGGVTVANVMNQSIQITTKVLETMEFSVGTVDPDTTASAHTACDAVQGTGTLHDDNSIVMGNAAAENSLEVGTAHDAYSFWRLSSNSSNGATVYYAGYTLSNTEGDQINPIYDLSGGHAAGDASAGFSHTGSEQFGLGMDVTDSTPGTYIDDYGDQASTPALSASWNTAEAANAPTDSNWHNPQLYPLTPTGSYGLANGSIATNDAGAQFAFDNNARTTPEPIASEGSDVVNCSTGLMRYVGNIAATTPAGIYTTKINYVASPEY